MGEEVWFQRKFDSPFTLILYLNFYFTRCKFQISCFKDSLRGIVLKLEKNSEEKNLAFSGKSFKDFL